jgi:hypothetical protein
MVENNGTEIKENNEKTVVVVASAQQLLTTSMPSSDEATSVLPLNCLPLTHQVAGHFYGKGRTRLGKAVQACCCWVFLFIKREENLFFC